MRVGITGNNESVPHPTGGIQCNQTNHNTRDRKYEAPL